MLCFKSTRWTKYLKVSNSDRWNYESNTRKKDEDWETDRGQRNCLYFWELSREERKNRGREEKEIEKMEAALIKGFWPTTAGTITVTYSGKHKLTHNVVGFMNWYQTIWSKLWCEGRRNFRCKAPYSGYIWACVIYGLKPSFFYIFSKLLRKFCIWIFRKNEMYENCKRQIQTSLHLKKDFYQFLREYRWKIARAVISHENHNSCPSVWQSVPCRKHFHKTVPSQPYIKLGLSKFSSFDSPQLWLSISFTLFNFLSLSLFLTLS